MFGFSKIPQPTIKICTGQVMAKSTQKELEKHSRIMLSSSKQNLKGYIHSGVVSGKFWMAGNEKEVCDVCRENERVGVIPFIDRCIEKFISSSKKPVISRFLQYQYL